MALSGEFIATSMLVQYEAPTSTWNDIGTVVNEDSLSSSRGEAETTAHGTTSRTYVPGLMEHTYSFTLMHNNTNGYSTRPQTVLEGYFTAGTSVSWRIRPNGTATGASQAVFTGFITSFETDFTADDQPVSTSVEIRITGGVTWSAQ